MNCLEHGVSHAIQSLLNSKDVAGELAAWQSMPKTNLNKRVYVNYILYRCFKNPEVLSRLSYFARKSPERFLKDIPDTNSEKLTEENHEIVKIARELRHTSDSTSILRIFKKEFFSSQKKAESPKSSLEMALISHQ